MSSLDYQLYVYDEESWREICDCDFLIDEPAKVHECDNAIVEPLRYIPGTRELYGDGLLEGGLCSEEFEFLAGLHRSADGEPVNKSCLSSYPVPDEELKFSDETVIFGGLITSHFGHMLCDGMTRLWYPASHPEDTTKVIFVVYPDQEFPYWDLLELAGIDRERVEIITEPTRFSHVLVPDETSFSLGKIAYKKEWGLALNRIRSSVEPSSHKKVYFTRRQLQENGGCVGEDYFEDFFRANGFYVVAPETLPLRDQIALIAGADEFVCTMGTIAHQIMFASPGTRQVVLNRSGLRVHVAPMMNAVSETTLTFVDVYKNILPDSQAGGSRWLLAPTEHWETFLQDHPEYSSAAAAPYPLEHNMMDYLEKWAAWYGEHPRAYNWIKGSSVVDVIARLNLYLRDYEIDRADFESMYCQIIDFSWSEDALCLNGRFEYALAQEDALSGAVVFECSNDEAKKLEFPVSFAALAAHEFAWTATIDVCALIERFQGPEAEQWYMQMELLIDGTPSLISLGRKRPAGSFGCYRRHVVEQQGVCALPIQDSQKALGFELATRDELVQRPLVNRIETLECVDGLLNMSGRTEHPLLYEEPKDLTLRLRSKSGWHFDAPVRWNYDHDTNMCRWEVELDPKKMTADAPTLGEGDSLRCFFTVLAKFEDFKLKGPFGYFRPVGSFAFYKSCETTADGFRLVPIQNRERRLGFRIESAQLDGSVKKTAE